MQSASNPPWSNCRFFPKKNNNTIAGTKPSIQSRDIKVLWMRRGFLDKKGGWKGMSVITWIRTLGDALCRSKEKRGWVEEGESFASCCTRGHGKWSQASCLYCLAWPLFVNVTQPLPAPSVLGGWRWVLWQMHTWTSAHTHTQLQLKYCRGTVQLFPVAPLQCVHRPLLANCTNCTKAPLTFNAYHFIFTT